MEKGKKAQVMHRRIEVYCNTYYPIVGLEDPAEIEFYRQLKYFRKVHQEAHEVIDCLISQVLHLCPSSFSSSNNYTVTILSLSPSTPQPVVREMLPQHMRDQLTVTNSLYCPILGKFFADFSKKSFARRVQLGFIPAPASALLKAASNDGK